MSLTRTRDEGRLRKIGRMLGNDWLELLRMRANTAYVHQNAALATGNFADVQHFTSDAYRRELARVATRQFKTGELVASWRLHALVRAPDVVCARLEEILNKDEHFAQVALRLVTDQSLEIRDRSGVLVRGSHDAPVRVTEYLLFERKMWVPTDQWTLVKRLQESDPQSLVPSHLTS